MREDYVPEERLWSLMAACDVLVNLRSPTMGETSGSVIRGLSLGKPMLVSDVGWFSELPDDVALKIPVDEYEVPTIAAALELAADRMPASSAPPRRTTSGASTTWGGWPPMPMPRRSSRPPAAMRSPTPCSGGSPKPRPTSASTTPGSSSGRRGQRARVSGGLQPCGRIVTVLSRCLAPDPVEQLPR